MSALPETSFARAGDLSIAYQVVGEGDVDVILIPQWLSNIEQYWEHPTAAYFLRRLASFSRLIMFDKRGSGLSDAVPDTQTLEERMDDVLAVMDAVGLRARGPVRAIGGRPDGGAVRGHLPGAMREPGAVRRLRPLAGGRRLSRGAAGRAGRRLRPALDRRLGLRRVAVGARADARRRRRAFAAGGGGSSAIRCAPGWSSRSSRRSTRSTSARSLPAIKVPTLIMHRRGDRLIDVANGRYLAGQIEGARYVELPGEDHIWFAGDADALLDEIEEFVTGARGTHDPDRVLATVMFTDIVRSTEHAARLGDRRWHDLISDHDQLVGRQIAVYRGRTIRSTGDGVFASFDGPARAIRCALSLVDVARTLDVDIRAGLHTGECELAGDDLAGVTVHIGARIADLAEPRQVLVSGTVRDLVVGSNIGFQFRGTEALQGVPASGECSRSTAGRAAAPANVHSRSTQRPFRVHLGESPGAWSTQVVIGRLS